MAADVALHLFGRFRAVVAGFPVPDEAWHGHRSKAVVKLLALAPDHQLHRGQLIESLWPELDPPAAGANLRKAVHFARRALPPPALEVRDAVLGLAATGLWIDVDEFEAAVTIGDLDRALDLYAGDLLVEDRYDPWAEEYRAHLHARFASLLSRRADRCIHDGEFARAAELFDRLLRLDPGDETAVAGVMRASALSGQPSLALTRYRDHQARLARDPGTLPSDSLRRLRDRIAAPDGAAAPIATTPPTAGDLTERKLVTVVLLDAVPAAEATDPEVMARDLQGWASLATEVLGSWDGVCERLLPGTLVAVFGVPRLHEDDAARALHATLDLVARSPSAVRAGVATGEVVVRADPTGVARGITGEVMGAADRLRQAAPVGRVAVAERTCRLVARFRFDDPVCLGGAGLPEIWGRLLVGRVVDPSGDAEPVDAPMVGRDAELATLVAAFDDAARSGRPRFATVLGPAGIGKSRLVDEAVAALTARRPGMRVLRGRCLPAGRGGVYSALGEILCRACGISLTDPVPTVQARLRQRLRALFGRDELTEATLAALAASIGIALPGAAWEGMDPRAVADELSRSWPRFVTAVAGSGPAVVVVEDLHWAGNELLDALARIATGALRPVLFVATGRPDVLDEHAQWVRELQPGVVIPLAPLDERDSRALLTCLPSAHELPASTRQRLLVRAEGNPFFLQELALHAARGGAGALPDSVSAVLAARLDALASADKQVLQRAAVTGRVFWTAPVARGVSGDVAAALDRLVREGFVERRRRSALSGHPEYAFRHALTHEVAYASLPRDRRARVHAEVGAWLEEIAGRSRDDLAELLAFHWAEASADPADMIWAEPADRERVRRHARRWLFVAGNVARARFSTAAAIDWHTRALALATTGREKVEVLEALGRDHDAAFSGDEAVHWYGEALAITRTDGRLAADRARLCRRIAWLMATTPGSFRISPDAHAVDELLAEGLEFADDEVSRAWLLLTHGVSARLWRGSEPFGQGREPDPVPIERRVRSAETALRVGRTRGQPDLLVAAERALTILYGIAGRYSDAVALARRQVTVLSTARSTLEQADLLREAAVHAILVDADFEEALTLARRCYSLSAGTSPHQVMHATWALLAALYHLGRWDELQSVAREHLTAFRAAPAASDCQFVREGPLIAATVLAHRGDQVTARGLVAEFAAPRTDTDDAVPWRGAWLLADGDAAGARRVALSRAGEGGLSGPQHALWLVEALVALADWPALAACLTSARGIVEGNALLGPVCLRAAGLADARAERRADAVEQLRAAVSAFEALQVPFEAARTHEELAGLLDGSAAREHLEAALDVYRRLRARPRLDGARNRIRDHPATG